ncbi:ribonuclease Y [Candidatus Phytoplasma oryzae]|uniref:Ribonuclease Y n=1 Tax=Candidatus Phytoplasma oryzae TaxID=203274 RepID=A0A139JRA4_9MOLU|nr:ribonuclease Y [Candidatus Phytoplasma oryzae]KXT29380.1 ribonuclease Y [Candidatus Phytoplasma oryzae]RAM57965.1 ribonuclease [Candidatus Phytoplasma oryzae]
MKKIKIILVIILFCFASVCSFLGTFFYFLKQKKKIEKKTKQAEKKIKEKILKSEIIFSQMILEAKQKNDLLKKETENDLNQRRKVIVNLEEKIIYKEELLVSRIEYLNKKEELLYQREQEINNIKIHIEQIRNKTKEIFQQQKKKLEEISLFTQQQAKLILFNEAKKKIIQEIMNFAKEKEEEFKIQVKKKAQTLLIYAMQTLSKSDIISDNNMSIVFLPNDDIKGKIIGKEGRNIRNFEIITGVDLIIEDIPNTVVLSSFDPIRRETAKKTLENLINDGRITPASIEKTFKKTISEMDTFIQEIGEIAVYETKIGIVDKEIINLLGKLNFRMSYGQNVLNHSLEVAFLAGKLAAEIGEDEIITRRAGLLHDIGKALNHKTEGNHVKIGVELAIKYNEPIEVVDSIASHHEDQEPNTIVAILVSIADTISSSRPGARKESIENYFQRINQLEQIADSIEGVEKSYAIRSGREIRVIVKSKEINDLQTFIIAQKIKKEIQKNKKIHNNRTIKITVIRELRIEEKLESN